MPDPIRQKLVDAIKARFNAVTIAGGYNHDLANRIYVWRDLSQGAASFKTAELPALNIRDTDNNPEHFRLGNGFDNELLFEVDFITTTDPADAWGRKLMADVYRAIGQDPKWNVAGTNLAIDTLPRGDTFAVIHGKTRYAGGTVKFTIKHRTKSWKPDEQI